MITVTRSGLGPKVLIIAKSFGGEIQGTLNAGKTYDSIGLTKKATLQVSAHKLKNAKVLEYSHSVKHYSVQFAYYKTDTGKTLKFCVKQLTWVFDKVPKAIYYREVAS